MVLAWVRTFCWGDMQSLSFEQFLIFPKHGYVYFFSLEGACGLCKQYESEIKQYDVPNLIKVWTENEDDLMNIGIKAVPCTRIYDTQDKIYFERYGVLYQKQVTELLGKVKDNLEGR